MTTQTRLTDTELAAVYYNAGFRGDDLVTMVATSFAENTDVDPFLQSRIPVPGSPNGRENSWGIAQINLDVHPLTREQAQNPVQAANYAYTLYQRNGFEDWSAYTAGSWRQYQDRAWNAVRGIMQAPTQIPDIVFGVVNKFFGWIQGNPQQPPQQQPPTDNDGWWIFNPNNPPTIQLPNVEQAARDGATQAVNAALGPIGKPLADIAEFVRQYTRVIFDTATWWRILLLSLAIFMILGGIIIYVIGD